MAEHIVSNGETNSGIILNSYDSMTVLDGGMANDILVSPGGTLFISSGGTAEETDVHSGGSLYVSGGGIATGIVENGGYVEVEEDAEAVFVPNTFSGLILSNGDRATVHSGTTANRTVIDQDGELFVSSVGTVNGTTVNSRGRLYVRSDGTANSTMVNGGGLFVFSNGTASNTTVNNGGTLNVDSGGTATEIMAADGTYLYFAVAPDTYIQGTSAGSAFEIKDGAVSNYTVNSKGRMWVFSGGVAISTTVNYGGWLDVDGGGMANSTTVNNGGTLNVDSGGTATEIMAADGTYLYFAVAPDTYIQGTSAGSAFEIKDGAVSNYTVNSGGKLEVRSGGVANSTTVNNKGELGVSSGGVANNTTVNRDGSMWVSVGGVANSTTVNNKGELGVSSGGTATGAIIHSSGEMNILKGGFAVATTVTPDGKLYVSSGGTVNSTMVGSMTESTFHSGGILFVSRGGAASNTMVGPNGSMDLAGFAEAITATDMGIVTIIKGGTANGVILNSGVLFISSGGTATGIVENGGFVEIRGGDAEFAPHTFSGIVDDWATVHSGTTAVNTEVGGSWGWLRIYDGGIASNTTVNLVENRYKDSTGMHVYSGGTASNITINSGGSLRVSKGGKLTGQMIVENGAIVSASNGAIIDFDISGVSPTDGARINDLSLVRGMPLYTITVSDEQGKGVYTLAKGAADFNSAITVQNTLGETLGTLAVDGFLETENRRYMLNLTDASLTLTCYALTLDRIISDETVAVSKYDIFRNPVVALGGTLTVLSGGTATEIQENGGYLDFENESEVTIAPNTIEGLFLSDASATMHSGTTANNITVDSLGRLDIFSGGTANGITLNSGGSLTVSSGGTASAIDWTPCVGTLKIDEGAEVSYASQYTGVYYGEEGRLVSHALIMSELAITKGGSIYVMSGKLENTVGERTSFFISSGGTANNTLILAERNTFHVYSGGVANDTLIIASGDNKNFYVSSGGTANRTVVFFADSKTSRNNYLYICNGGIANDTMLLGNYNSMFISSGGTANNTLVNGELIVFSGGIASNIDVRGRVTISNGGLAANVKENGGWVDDFRNGGTAIFVSNSFSGMIGMATVHSGTTALHVMVDSNGSMTVFSGGIADDISVYSRSVLHVSSGGSLTNCTVLSGGSVRIDNGKLTGRTVIQSGGSIEFKGGAVLDFDLTQTAPETGARINTLSQISGTPTYTITVNANQTEGTYKLAEDVSEFEKTITVVNSLGDELGMLMVGETVLISDTEYTLILSDNTLSLKIGEADIPAPYTSDGLVLSKANIDVKSGDVFHDTFVFSDGNMSIHEGGIASDTNVYLGGNLSVEAGTANNTAIYNGGSMFVSCGGTVNSTIVNPGGSLCVSSGGTALEIKENGGFIDIQDGAVVTFASNTIRGIYVSGSTFALHSGTTMTDMTTIVGNGSMLVFSGGLVDRVLIGDYRGAGYLYIYGGGVVNSIVAMSSGSIYVESGGIVNQTIIVNHDFSFNISSGGTANNLSLASGKLFVSSGGVVNNLTALGVSGKGPEIRICSGGTATNVVYNSDGKLSIEDGAVIHGITFNPGMSMSVAGKTTMTGIIENGGAVKVQDGAEVSFAPNAFSGVILGESGNYRYTSATVHSGTTAVSTTMSDGGMDVYNGGLAVDTTVTGGSLTVLSGGTAINAIASGSGSILIRSGGTAENLVFVDDKGKRDIQRGAVIHGLTLNSGIRVDIASDTFITGIVENGGYVRVQGSAITASTFVSNTFSGQVFSQESATLHSGTTAYDTTITSKARIEVYESGRVVETTINGGGLTIYSGGAANSTTINSGGSMTIYSGIINSTTINSGGKLTIYSGMINSTTINSGGRVEFYGKSDMVANNTIVNSGGSFFVNYGVIASNIVENGGYVSVSNRSDATFASNTFSGIILSNAAATVHSGTTAVKTLIDSSGRLYVYDGGIANDTTLNIGGELIISSGGTATNIIASSGTWLRLTVASDTYIQGTSNGSAFEMKDAFLSGYAVKFGRIEVCSDGTAENTLVNGDGELYVSSGGTATDIIWTPCVGHVFVDDGGMATFASQYSGVYYGSDNQLLSHEAVMDSKSLDGDCEMNVMSGGITTETTVNSGGYLYVSGGGVTNSTTVNSDGSLYVSNGGTANSTMVNGGGLFVSFGGKIDHTSISNGMVNLSSGTASNTEITQGVLYVGKGGIANNTIVRSGGRLLVSSGGTLAGKMTFESGAAVSMDEGAILNFDLTQVEAGAEALVNDLSIIQGMPLYTLTASAILSEGLYLLAEGASTFDQTVSVVNIAGDELATLTVGETTAIGKYTYTLALTDSALSVNVVKVLPPDKPTISVDVSLPTNGNVIVSAEFSEDCVKREYALDGETWQTYIDEIVFSENGSVSFRGIDTAGKVSEIAEYEVLNIDKEPPEKPTASADITTATNKDVTVTAVFSEDSVLKEYSLDGEAWLAYTKAIILENNGIVYFRGTDEVGNTSEIASYEVVNIDRLAPEKPTVSADITTVTNKDVTVTAIFSEDSVKMEYSFDGENWLDYSGGIAFPENGTIMFRGTDAAGNASEVTSYTVDYIDRLAPEKPIVTADVTTVTKGNVKVSAEFSEDSEIKKYSLDGENWRDYTEAVEFTENGTVYFQGTDEAGNPSEIAEYTVANIDKDPPKKPIPSADITAPTNKTVTITVSFADDAEQASSLYRIGEEKEWHDYEENGVAITENTTVYFKAVDAAGNESEIASYTVDNIDKVAPEKPFVFASNTMLTNQDITVTAVFSEDSTVKEYSTDGQTWLSYTEPLVVSANGILLFRAKDEAGNISGLVTFEVGNIDKDVPVITLSGDNATPLHASTLSASTEDGLDLFYSTDKENWMKYEDQLEVTANAVYYFTATDAAGNIETAEYEFDNILPNSITIPQPQTWDKSDEAEQYIVEYSTDNFEHVIRITVDSNSLASFNVPADGIQWRVKPEGSDGWIVGEPVTAAETGNEPKLIKSDEDGNADVFFAKAVDIWESGYLAQHVGSINDWDGTNEYATVSGKNKLADIFEGSTDANILLMTDDDNGDGLFVDDIYTTLPGAVKEQQSRIAQIDEIRAGAGADIVDMTSQNFEYIGDGLTIHGGDGNDTIWANKGDNWLFGDAGNDRIVGASGNDVIVGGIGNDRMHGGGGNDIFTFCENWGADTVEQLVGGSVTLWFASGSMENWDKTTLTYTDGDNGVKVSGVTAEKITLKFGDDGSDQFATLSSMGAFFDATTERIFEESGKGILANL